MLRKHKKIQTEIFTLLMKYIVDFINGYVEPTRQGTRKGDAIGLSKTKCRAICLFLYNVDAPRIGGLKKMAKDLGVSYDVLKVWHSEEKVKALTSMHVVKFADEFFDFVEKLHKQKFKSYLAFLKKPLKQIVTGDDSSAGIELADLQPISDYHSYSDILQLVITKKFMQKFKVWNAHECATGRAVFNATLPPDVPSETPVSRESKKQTDILLLDELMSILTKQKISESQQKYLLYSLRHMKQRIQALLDPESARKYMLHIKKKAEQFQVLVDWINE